MSNFQRFLQCVAEYVDWHVTEDDPNVEKAKDYWSAEAEKAFRNTLKESLSELLHQKACH